MPASRPKSWPGLPAVVSILLLHSFLLVAVYSVLYAFGLIRSAPPHEGLGNWDAGLYRGVAEGGYDSAGSPLNAFFPLFPYLWRWSGLSFFGISIFNMLSSFIGAGVLAWAFGFSGRQLLVVLSAPMMFFTMVPYSEGLFFLWSAMLLAGLHRQRLALVLLGLVGCCLTRSAATLLIPAYLFAELLTYTRLADIGRVLRNVGLGLLAIGAALGSVMLLQYRSHGDPLAFYKVHSIWGQVLGLPGFPLRSSAGINVLWLDMLALLVCLLALGVAAIIGLRWLAGWLRRVAILPAEPLSKAVVFTLGYCVGAGFFILFYQGGDLVGFGRYIFASPFFAVLLWQLSQCSRRTIWGLLLAAAVLLGLIAFSLGMPQYFNSFTPGQSLWYFGLCFVYLLAHVGASRQSAPYYRETATGLYILNLMLLVYLHSLFLDGMWLN